MKYALLVSTLFRSTLDLLMLLNIEVVNSVIAVYCCVDLNHFLTVGVRLGCVYFFVYNEHTSFGEDFRFLGHILCKLLGHGPDAHSALMT